MNGSAQASGRSGCQPSRRLPNTPSSLMPTMVRMAMPSVRSSSAMRAVQVGPGEAPLGEQGLGLGTVGRVELVAPAPASLDDHRWLPHPTIR